MKQINILTISILSLLTLSFADGHAATIAAVSCSQSHVQTAVSAASSGDTVIVPTGTCSWSSGITIGKPISIIGAGSGAGGTKLIASGTMSGGFFNVTGFTSTALTRISKFYFEMTDWTPECAIKVNDVSADNIRIDNNTFNQGSKPILFYNPKGLIDNNYFYNANLTIEYSAGSVAKATASWSSMAAGTAGATFIEDNHFIDDANFAHPYTNERIGTFNGGKLVIRYNHFESNAVSLGTDGTAMQLTPIMTHGSAAAGASPGYWQAGAGGRRGQSVVEIYENVFEGRRIDFPVILRGSANLVYNNTTTSQSSIVSRIYLREEEYYEVQWNPARTAWPAEDQVHNSFFWNNTFNGAAQSTSNFIAEANINQDRDYFLHAPQATGGKETFTGANGASNTYPTDGVKYPTYGTMVFSPEGPNAYYGYVPYTYPHPLRSGQLGGLSAPVNFRKE